MFVLALTGGAIQARTADRIKIVMIKIITIKTTATRITTIKIIRDSMTMIGKSRVIGTTSTATIHLRG